MYVSKLETVKRQLNCAVRLIALQEDPLPIFNIVYSSLRVLTDLAIKKEPQEIGFYVKWEKEHLGGRNKFWNFLKHADKDPDTLLPEYTSEAIDALLGQAITYYRGYTTQITAEMQAFDTWMKTRYPDKFGIKKHRDIEIGYREALLYLREQGRDTELELLKFLLEAYKNGIIPLGHGYLREEWWESIQQKIKMVAKDRDLDTYNVLLANIDSVRHSYN